MRPPVMKTRAAVVALTWTHADIHWLGRLQGQTQVHVRRTSQEAGRRGKRVPWGRPAPLHVEVHARRRPAGSSGQRGAEGGGQAHNPTGKRLREDEFE